MKSKLTLRQYCTRYPNKSVSVTIMDITCKRYYLPFIDTAKDILAVSLFDEYLDDTFDIFNTSSVCRGRYAEIDIYAYKHMCNGERYNLNDYWKIGYEYEN